MNKDKSIDESKEIGRKWEEVACIDSIWLMTQETFLFNIQDESEEEEGGGGEGEEKAKEEEKEEEEEEDDDEFLCDDQA